MADEQASNTPLASLKKLDISEGLTDAQLERIAADTSIITLNEGQSPLFTDARDDRFFIVSSGKMRVSFARGGGNLASRTYAPGDFFGAEKLLYGRLSLTAAIALEPTELLCIGTIPLAQILRETPTLTENLKKATERYHFKYDKHFSWLSEGERIILIERKHPSVLVVSLILPVVLGWVGVLFLLLASIISVSSLRVVVDWLGIAMLVVAVIWGVWRWFDWGNDYYVITNRRVVRLEKVLGLYDSRQESPLSMIQAVDLHTKAIGRMLGYGNVIIRTYTSRITFDDIEQPYQLKALVEKYQVQTRQTQVKLETSSMERIIRQRIGLPEEGGTPAPSILERQAASQTTQAQPSQAQPSQAPPSQQPTFGERFVKFLKTRLEEGDVITYRKHWIILLKKVWLPTLLSLVILILMILLLQQRMVHHSGPSLITIILSGSVIFLMPLFWWTYQLIDWRNDIYQITLDKITDIERKPFGDEIAKSALLENIQSLEHERIGLLGLLLNYGSVIIVIAGGNFDFISIHDPARAQQDIFNRMYNLRQRKDDTEARKQHERVADWVAAYHRQVTGEHKPGNPSGTDSKSG